jgi:hypothetical protein
MTTGQIFALTGGNLAFFVVFGVQSYKRAWEAVRTRT